MDFGREGLVPRAVGDIDFGPVRTGMQQFLVVAPEVPNVFPDAGFAGSQL
jgi:hypothetical protein